MHDGTSNGFAASFDKIAQTHPDRVAIDFHDATYTYSQIRDLAAVFAIKMRAAGVGEKTIVQSASTDPVILLPAMLAATVIGARFATPATIHDTENSDPKCVLTTSDAQAADGVKILVVDPSFSPALFEREAKNAVWEGIHTHRRNLRLWHHAKPVCVNLAQYSLIYAKIQTNTETLDVVPKIAVLHEPASWRYLVRAAAALSAGSILIDITDLATVLAAKPDFVSGTCNTLKALMETKSNTALSPRAELSDPELWRAQVSTLARRFEALFVTFEHQEFGLLNCGIYDFSDFGFLEYDVGPLAPKPVTIVDAQGVDIVGQKPGYVAVTSTSGDRRLTGYVGGWGANNDLRILGLEGSEETELAQNVDLALVDAVLRSVDGIEDAASFESPKAEAEELLAFAVFSDESNRSQSTELARHNCQQFFGSSGSPIKIWTLNSIPKMADGKPDRNKCRNLIKDALKKA